jgi:hypothetical protein
MSTAELASSYAALILADDGIEITVSAPVLFSRNFVSSCSEFGGAEEGREKKETISRAPRAQDEKEENKRLEVVVC